VKLLDAIERHSRLLGDRAALVDDHGGASYRELQGAISHVARELHRRGITAGDVVALSIEPTAPGVALLLGTIAAGAVAAPINVRLSPAEIATYLDMLSPALTLTDPASPVQFDGALTFPNLNDTASFADRFGASLSDPARLPEIPDHAPSVAMPTGGTTGLPKAALWSRAGLSDITISNCIHTKVDRNDYELYISPLFHITIITGLLPTLYVGGTVRMMGKFDPDRAAELFQTSPPTRIMTTPTAFTWILERLPHSEALASHEMVVIYGAASNSPDFRKRVHEKLPRAELITGYGATEHGPVVRLYSTDPEADRPGALGRPVAGVDILVVDPESGLALEDGQVGELHVLAPWQLIGYLGSTDSPFSSRGYVRSGDIGARDPDGCLFLAGRSKEIIKTGGENVFPIEVERVLHLHPDITDVGVYGVNDEVWGERVEAALVVTGSTELNPEDLKAFCGEQLAGYKIPKRFRFVPAIPYTPNMKIDRRQLVRDAESLS
jgi:fatty-acyl-CoA synthase